MCHQSHPLSPQVADTAARAKENAQQMANNMGKPTPQKDMGKSKNGTPIARRTRGAAKVFGELTTGIGDAVNNVMKVTAPPSPINPLGHPSPPSCSTARRSCASVSLKYNVPTPPPAPPPSPQALSPRKKTTTQSRTVAAKKPSRLRA